MQAEAYQTSRTPLQHKRPKARAIQPPDAGQIIAIRQVGGLHVTSLPDEAAHHADTIFTGPGDDTWPAFLADFRAGRQAKIYRSQVRTLVGVPPMRRDLIKRYLVHNKPVIIGEFGCCTYQGAGDAGGWGWAIADLSANPPQLKGNYVRDEGLQARELTDQLAILEDVGVDGAFVFTFVSPTLTYNEDPTYDLDMASYSLVKSYAGKHGVTYPDMPWEPKESFKAVADYFVEVVNESPAS